MKKERFEFTLEASVFKEIAPIIEDLKKSFRLRKIVDKQKRIEELAAKPLKRFMLKLGLSKYTPRLNTLRSSLHQSVWAVLAVFYRLREEKRRAWNESSFGFDPLTRQKFFDASNAFNNFCLGVTAIDSELGVEIECKDIMLSSMENTPLNQTSSNLFNSVKPVPFI